MPVELVAGSVVAHGGAGVRMPGGDLDVAEVDAGGVAYSRVHTGVHYPGDVVIGSIVGAGTAATVAATFDHLLPTAQIGRLWPGSSLRPRRS